MLLSFLALLIAPPTACASPAASSIVLFRADELERLEAEYQAAFKSWREKIRATERQEERKALRKHSPASEFWPRFEALAESGEGRAFLWMIRNAEDAGTPTNDAGAKKSALFEQLFAKHLDDPWFMEALELLAKERRDLGNEFVESKLALAAEKAKSDETRATAMFVLGQLLSKDESTLNRGTEWLERVSKEFPKTKAGKAAGESLFVQKNLVVGATAPDFEGTTFEGQAFKLSDYRGKVVVLEFFGFW